MCLSLLAIFCPPLAVLFRAGCGTEFWLNLLLTIFCWLPGACHACCVVHKRQDVGSVNVVTHVQVPSSPPPAPAPAAPTHISINMVQNPNHPGASAPYPIVPPSHPHPGHAPSAPELGFQAQVPPPPYNPNSAPQYYK